MMGDAYAVLLGTEIRQLPPRPGPRSDSTHTYTRGECRCGMQKTPPARLTDLYIQGDEMCDWQLSHMFAQI